MDGSEVHEAREEARMEEGEEDGGEMEETPLEVLL